MPAEAPRIRFYAARVRSARVDRGPWVASAIAPSIAAKMTLLELGDPLAHRALHALLRAETCVRRALAADLERDGLAPFLARWLALPLFAGLPPEAAGLEDRRANAVAGLASSLRLAGTATIEPPWWDHLGRLAMPVLVLAGEHDAKFAALGARLAAAIGANASFATVPGAGHAAHLERPDAFLALVEPFLLP